MDQTGAEPRDRGGPALAGVDIEGAQLGHGSIRGLGGEEGTGDDEEEPSRNHQSPIHQPCLSLRKRFPLPPLFRSPDARPD